MRKAGSITIEGNKKPVASADSRKPLQGHADVEAKRAAQAAKKQEG